MVPPHVTLSELGASSSAEIPLIERVASTHVIGSTRVTKDTTVTAMNTAMRMLCRGMV